MPASRIAVCSWSLRPKDKGHLLELVRETGLPRVQLALSPLVDRAADWAGAGELLREAGIELASGMMALRGEDYTSLESIARTGGLRRAETWPANRGHAAAVAQQAAALGLRLVTFHAGFIPESRGDAERARLLDRLRETADIFARHDVELGLETGQETATTLLEALDDLDRPNVGVNFDPANMILYGKGDPVEALGSLALRVKQIHIKDAVPAQTPGTWGTEMPIGRGAVDWPAFFAVARSLPRIDFVIEREGGEGRMGDIRLAREFIMSMVDAEQVSG